MGAWEDNMLQRKFAMALLGASLSLTACQKQTAEPDMNSVAATVEADAKQIVVDYDAKDAAKVASHDGEGYVGMYAGTPNIVGAAADQASTVEQFKDPAIHYALTGKPKTTVSKSGDIAVFESGYAFTTTDATTKKPVIENGTWIAIYRKQGDTMKLWRSILIAGPKAS
jgi:hypothetical protein